MLGLAVLCQALTLLIAWPAWNVRSAPALLPLVDWPIPQISFGWLLMASLVAVPFWPRWGLLVHAALFALSCVADQHRLQPQVISLIVLMAGCIGPRGALYARHYMAALWLWAGVHKLISPEWFGWSAWVYVHECGLPPDAAYLPFAWLVALFEIALGLLALWQPRWAAWGCVAMHLGILLTLSPLVRNFNPSVWPWNLATAVVGAWLLDRSADHRDARGEASSLSPWWNWGVTGLIVATYLLPAGYYFDWVNVHLAFSLYSGHLPRAMHTTSAGAKRLDGWTGLAVPFPDSPWLLRRYFARTAEPGDKLHLWDPRWGFGSSFYQLSSDGQVQPITREQFHSEANGQRGGTEIDDPNAAWRIERAGAQLERGSGGVLASVKLAGTGDAAEVLAELALLPNLREVGLTGFEIAPADLERLASWPRLEILELRGAHLHREHGLRLAKLSQLRWFAADGVELNQEDAAFLGRQLQVLRLPAARLGPGALPALVALPQLQQLDLRDAQFPPEEAVAFGQLQRCEWLVLSHTRLPPSAISALARLSQLEILELHGVELSASQRAELASALPACRIAW